MSFNTRFFLFEEFICLLCMLYPAISDSARRELVRKSIFPFLELISIALFNTSSADFDKRFRKQIEKILHYIERYHSEYSTFASLNKLFKRLTVSGAGWGGLHLDTVTADELIHAVMCYINVQPFTCGFRYSEFFNSTRETNMDILEDVGQMYNMKIDATYFDDIYEPIVPCVYKTHYDCASETCQSRAEDACGWDEDDAVDLEDELYESAQPTHKYRANHGRKFVYSH